MQLQRLLWVSVMTTAMVLLTIFIANRVPLTRALVQQALA